MAEDQSPDREQPAGPPAPPPAFQGAMQRQMEPRNANLADILERVLDKGIVIAGDISVSLVDVELLTIRIRLLVASVDKAKEMGIDWWENDPMLSSRARRQEIDAGRERSDSLEQENAELRRRLEQLEADRG
ncbi:gas vesicle protein GvpJ [Janibacter cremeus]|uniref:gas vesicle protein GvpJ n=1 Tax=Janibacter cremeus TaxID=1285192 RepID=UPI003211E7E2